MIKNSDVLRASNNKPFMVLYLGLSGKPVPEETFTHSHLSWSSTNYDPWHFPCSIWELDSLYAQPLSRSSLVYSWDQNPPLHTQHTFSSSNHYLLFATHAHSCSAKISHLFLVSLSHHFTFNSIFYLNVTHPSDHSHLFPLQCHLSFFPYNKRQR